MINIKVFTVDNLNLYELCDSNADYNIAWNLDATVAPLLKELGQKVCKKLITANRCYIAPYNIFYIPAKQFSVTYLSNGKTVNLYDIEQYYPDMEEPETIKEIEQLGKELLEALALMNMYPTKLASPVAMWEEAVMNELDLPTFLDMPYEANRMAWRCGGRTWTEIYKMGYWEQAYDYDLISGFPIVAKNLIDIRNLEWIQSDKYVKQAIYGYTKCQVTINDDVTVSPIIYEDEEGNLSTPTGTWPTYLTKGEIDFIYKWGIGHVVIEDGWWAMPNGELSKPFKEAMSNLLAFKEHDNELVRMLAKRSSVGSYGKLGENYDRKQGIKLGKHFLPCWFAEISTTVRLQVAQLIYENKLQDNLIHVSTDGVLLDKKIEPWTNNGGWKLSVISSALTISSGLIYFSDKKPKGLHIEDILEMINNKPLKSYYSRVIPRRVTLVEATQYKELDKLGNIKDTYSSIDLYLLHPEREFAKLPETGEQLLSNKYESKPKKVKFIALVQ